MKKSLTIPQKSNTSFATKYCKKVIEKIHNFKSYSNKFTNQQTDSFDSH